MLQQISFAGAQRAPVRRLATALSLLCAVAGSAAAANPLGAAVAGAPSLFVLAVAASDGQNGAATVENAAAGAENAANGGEAKSTAGATRRASADLKAPQAGAASQVEAPRRTGKFDAGELQRVSLR